MDHLLILTSSITVCVSVPGFTSLVGIPIGIASSTMGLNWCNNGRNLNVSVNN